MAENLVQDDWLPIAVLANIDLDEAIGNSFISLAPMADPRVIELTSSHQKFGEFLNKFTDAFSVQKYPTVLLVRSDVSGAVLNSEAIGSFRDIVAVSTLLMGRSREIINSQGRRVVYSDTFDLYPWTIDKDFDDLVAVVPGMAALHLVEKFGGQVNASVPHRKLNLHEIDEPLCTAMLASWERFYVEGHKTWGARALFRSLSIAYAALEVPAGPATRLLDYGRSITLWVSAFETLVHPGKGGNVSFRSVYRLLENVVWRHHKLRHHRYFSYPHPHKTVTRKILACWLYGEIHRSRNKFAHGEPVGRSDLRIKSSRRMLFHLAAPLYRMTLSGFLRMEPPVLGGATDEELGIAIAKRMDFDRPQKIAEEALIKSRVMDDDLRDALKGR